MSLGYANDDALVDADWAQAHLDDPNVRFVEVDVDTTELRAEPYPRRGRLELDEPAVRRHPPRHRRPRGVQRAAVGLGHRPGHDDRAVRRQQQLVRRLGVLAAEAVRPQGRPDHQRRAQVLARQRPAAVRRRGRRTTPPATNSRKRTSACARSATTSCRASATRAWPWWTSARRPSSTARSSRLPA